MALQLSREGANLILVARRKNKLEQTRKLIQEISTAKVQLVVADITQKTGIARIQKTVKNNGSLNVLINNAGLTAHGRFDETKIQVLYKTMQLNFFAAVELTSQLLPYIKNAKGTKRIIYISTVSGLYGIPGRYAYSASKAAGHAWMQSMRIELKNFKIHCQIVCPGYTMTALRTTGLGQDGKVLAEEQNPNAVSPQEMANIIIKNIHKNKKIILTNASGRFLFWMRTLFPGILESVLAKKLKSDY